MSIQSVLAASESIARDAVVQETWGHLNPKHSTVFQGTIDIACDGGGEYLVVDYRLMSENGEFVCDGPLFYEHSNDFACEVSAKKEKGFYRYSVEYSWDEDGPHWSIQQTSSVFNCIEQIG